MFWLTAPLPSPPVVSRPGAHWDGVDRSNGFERDYFREMNKKKERDRIRSLRSFDIFSPRYKKPQRYM